MNSEEVSITIRVEKSSVLWYNGIESKRRMPFSGNPNVARPMQYEFDGPPGRCTDDTIGEDNPISPGGRQLKEEMEGIWNIHQN